MAAVILAAARKAIECLVPAHAALAAERDTLRENALLARMHHDELAESYRKLAAEGDRYRAVLEEARELLQHIALGDAPPHKASVAADKAAVRIREALEGGTP